LRKLGFEEKGGEERGRRTETRRELGTNDFPSENHPLYHGTKTGGTNKKGLSWGVTPAGWSNCLVERATKDH